MNDVATVPLSAPSGKGRTTTIGKVTTFPTPTATAPAEQSGPVTPNRAANDALRLREYLTRSEVEALRKAARKNCQGYCDYTVVLLVFRHGLRSSELLGLEWGQIAW